MKKYFPVLALISLTLFSCGSDEDSLQKIDQLLNIYIQDASGNNLLHPTDVGSYTGISMNDELAPTDVANVNYSRKMLSDSIYFIEYNTGATREFVKDSSDGSKIYRSLIEVSLTKKISDTQNEPVDIDTLEILYRNHPSVFEVSKVYYNNVLKFSKIPDQPNVVTITK